MITYGLAPVGLDLHRKSSLVLVTSLSLHQMEIIQPANFWIGPSAVSHTNVFNINQNPFAHDAVLFK